MNTSILKVNIGRISLTKMRYSTIAFAFIAGSQNTEPEKFIRPSVKVKNNMKHTQWLRLLKYTPICFAHDTKIASDHLNHSTSTRTQIESSATENNIEQFRDNQGYLGFIWKNATKIRRTD
ncbi:unnamed protein product [Owenia fusiformis]|uniref:Uncharacterized protein n=1 Tax=Owenia fusiformis TaxID=6347 RepID=A0A8J1UR40_OWEFU|nr:unnamed protein product [Owenia fusiformis]